jgi:hypothetical protein
MKSNKTVLALETVYLRKIAMCNSLNYSQLQKKVFSHNFYYVK